jgi:hypothetical protein
MGEIMRRLAFFATVFATVLVVVLPFVGGGGPGIAATASTASVVGDFSAIPIAASVTATAQQVVRPEAESSMATTGWTPRIDEAAAAAEYKADLAALKTDSEHLAQKPVPKPIPPVTASGAASGTSERRAALEASGSSCPGNIGGSPGGAPGVVSAGGVSGTTSDDLASFAFAYNANRVANCLAPVPMGNFFYDSCMEQRLFWMAESPSEDPMDAWGHMGSVRVDGVPSVGCDGNLAGGYGNTGATVANKWWGSTGHRNSLYRPTHTGSTGGVCIAFAMTHGGVPNESYDFTRAAARWVGC